MKAEKCDLMAWKVHNKTPFPYEVVGGLSKLIPVDIQKKNGNHELDTYFHVAMFINEYEIIHAHPPKATIDTVDYEFLKNEQKIAAIEIWKPKIDIAEDVKESMVDYAKFRLDMKLKNGKWVGARYDWAAILFSIFAPLGLALNVRSQLHCAEIVFDVHLAHSMVLSIDGIKDPLVSPNNILGTDLHFKSEVL